MTKFYYKYIIYILLALFCLLVSSHHLRTLFWIAILIIAIVSAIFDILDHNQSKSSIEQHQHRHQ
ncbi:hypothetical protein [Lactobacillus terrae]|uniref:hypothetical protein n=1 Tax=Lactobacillus terrae TaxID=2269374 RepID=UPI000C1B7CC0|nr:hypothetical protein [Lactobacillus terrae]